MTVKINKDKINVREKLSELDKPSGIAGEAMLRADTPQEQFELINAGRKNLIINGDMRVNQRRSGVVTDAGNADEYLIDRFKHDTTSGSSRFDFERSSDTPVGFGHSAKYTCNTVESSPTGNNRHRFLTRIEGQDIQCLNGRTATLSFYVKSSEVGDAVVLFTAARTSAVPTLYSTTYTINSADTWERKIITLPELPNDIVNTTFTGLSIEFYLQANGSYLSGTKTTTWQDPSGVALAHGQTIDIGSGLNKNIAFTGIQLEVGNVATPFEHRSYGEELALCQRYYQKNGAAAGDNEGISVPYDYNRLRGQFQTFATTLRTMPAVSITNAEFYGNLNGTDQWLTPSAFSSPDRTVDGFSTDITAPAGYNFNNNICHPIRYEWEADAEL